MKTCLWVVALLVGLCSCTSRAVYDSVQTNQRNECDKLQTVQRQECLKRLAPSYDKYEEDRQRLLKKNQ